MTDKEKEYLRKLGKRITERRESLGYSKEELSKRVDLSRMHIYRVELGEHAVNIIFLKRIAKALGVHVKDLLD